MRRVWIVWLDDVRNWISAWLVVLNRVEQSSDWLGFFQWGMDKISRRLGARWGNDSGVRPLRVSQSFREGGLMKP